MVMVAAYGGLRVGELAGLRRGRMDILTGRVEIAEIAVEVAGTLPRSVTKILDDHLAEFTPPDPDAFVFTSPEGSPLRIPIWRQRYWRKAVAEAGLDPLRPHDLRHTAVALWIATGASPLEVSRRAGHTSASFTLDRYGHLFPEADEGVLSALTR
jgi:integrase